MSSSPFQEKIQKLQAATEEGQRKLESKERSIPTQVIIGIAIPFVVLIVLIFVQPSIVQKKEGSKYVRDSTKIFYWTVGLTLAGWLGLYLWTWCRGYKPSSVKF
jgi:hypothetical protein